MDSNSHSLSLRYVHISVGGKLQWQGDLYLWPSPDSWLPSLQIMAVWGFALPPRVNANLDFKALLWFHGKAAPPPRILTTTEAVTYGACIVQRTSGKDWGRRSCCSKGLWQPELLSWHLSNLFYAPSLPETKELNVCYFLMQSNSALSSP